MLDEAVKNPENKWESKYKLLKELSNGSDTCLRITADLDDKKYDHITAEEKDKIRNETTEMLTKIGSLQDMINTHDQKNSFYDDSTFKVLETEFDKQHKEWEAVLTRPKPKVEEKKDDKKEDNASNDMTDGKSDEKDIGKEENQQQKDMSNQGNTENQEDSTKNMEVD